MAFSLFPVASPLLIKTLLIECGNKNFHSHQSLWELHLVFSLSFINLSLRSCAVFLNLITSCFFIHHSSVTAWQGHLWYPLVECSRLGSDLLLFVRTCLGFCNTHSKLTYNSSVSCYLIILSPNSNCGSSYRLTVKFLSSHVPSFNDLIYSLGFNYHVHARSQLNISFTKTLNLSPDSCIHHSLQELSHLIYEYNSF